MVFLFLCIKNQPVNRKNIYSNLITNILWGGLRIHWWQVKLSLHNVPNMHENAKTYPRSLSLQHNCWEESTSHAVAVVYYHFLNRSSVYALMPFFFKWWDTHHLQVNEIKGIIFFSEADISLELVTAHKMLPSWLQGITSFYFCFMSSITTTTKWKAVKSSHDACNVMWVNRNSWVFLSNKLSEVQIRAKWAGKNASHMHFFLA